MKTARSLGLLPKQSRVAIDATGLETRHISRHYRWRLGGRHAWHEWPKLTVACDLESHIWLAAYVSIGPSHDSPQFAPTIRQAITTQRIKEVIGDKGYDAEHHHRLCREELGIPSTLIAVRKRSKLSANKKWPTTTYRREMKRRLPTSDYGQRWQIESAFSRNKRRLGSALRARSWAMQQWECQLRALTHNLMLVAAA